MADHKLADSRALFGQAYRGRTGRLAASQLATQQRIAAEVARVSRGATRTALLAAKKSPPPTTSMITTGKPASTPSGSSKSRPTGKTHHRRKTASGQLLQRPAGWLPCWRSRKPNSGSRTCSARPVRSWDCSGLTMVAWRAAGRVPAALRARMVHRRAQGLPGRSEAGRSRVVLRRTCTMSASTPVAASSSTCPARHSRAVPADEVHAVRRSRPARLTTQN